MATVSMISHLVILVVRVGEVGRATNCAADTALEMLSCQNQLSDCSMINDYNNNNAFQLMMS